MLEEVLEGYDEGKFIPGIYNYCDRWCERCLMTDKCFLYYREEERQIEHKVAGRHPHDMDVVIEDVHKSFEETLEMLREMAEEQGIDLDAIDAESLPPEPDVSEHALKIKSEKYSFAVHDFLPKLHKVINLEIEGINASSVINSIEAVDDIEDIRECYEIIEWYHFFISVKIARALSGKIEAVQEDKENDEDAMSDVNGSAKIAHEALVKSMNAFTRVIEWNQGLRDDIMPFLIEIYGLINEVDKEFPGHKDFKRPGFDE